MGKRTEWKCDFCGHTSYGSEGMRDVVMWIDNDLRYDGHICGKCFSVFSRKTKGTSNIVPAISVLSDCMRSLNGTD